MARPIGPTIELAASERVLRELERALDKGNRKVQRGALRALKRSLKSGKTAASRDIRAVINLKKKPVDERITTRVVSTRALVGTVAVRDKRAELVAFMTRNQIATAWRRQNARSAKGVSVKVYKKRGRLLVRDAFVNVGRASGKWHVMRRKTRERASARILYGPSMTKDFEKNLGTFAARASEVMLKNLEREINFALGRV